MTQWTVSPADAVAVLVASRLGGLCLSAPVFSSRLLSLRLRLGVVAVIAVCALVATGARPRLAANPEALLEALGRPLDGWLLIGSELFLGFALGWASLLVLLAVRGACHLMSDLMGLSLGVATDATSGPDVTALSRLYGVLAIFLFLSLDLHHTLIRAVVGSFSSVPPGTLDAASFVTLSGRLVSQVGPDLFAAAVTLALPIILVMMLVSLAQAVLGKMVPSTELLVLGLPVRTFLGLSLLVIILPVTVGAVRALFEAAVTEGEFLLENL